ncbi:MAG: hypothetical protein LCH81_12210 [Bacteroidetes bacterium]|nr:hypothetical protein [Bacteroidota bacterium]
MQQFNYVITFIFTFFLSNGVLKSQGCEGLSLSTGTLAGWDFWYANRSYSGATGVFTPVNPPNSNRIRIHSSTDNEFIYTNEICSVNIPWVPVGFDYSLQIGNRAVGSQVDRAAYTLHVDSTNSLILMNVFVALEYEEDHSSDVQPKFEINILDANGEAIPCGYFKVVAGNAISGFEVQPGNVCTSNKPIEYLPWKPISIDLTAQIGTDVTFMFTAYDCSHDGHFGFGATTIKCIEAKVSASSFCPGVSDSITLSAPDGFGVYEWSNGANTKDVTIYDPIPGQMVWVKFKPFSSLTSLCESYLEFKIPDGHDILPQSIIKFCEGTTAEVVTNAPSGSIFHWSNGQETPAIEVSQAGEYTVSVNSGDCTFRDTARVEQIKLPRYSLATTSTSCNGYTDGTICAVADSLQQEVTFAWNTGQNTPCLEDIGAGAYVVTISTVELGCTLTANMNVSEPSAILPQTTILRLPLCRDWETGQVEVTASGGTPPYQMAWSNGEVGSIAQVSGEGLYKVSVKDTNGCQVLDSVQVSTLKYSIQKRDNGCINDSKGEISIQIQTGIPPYQFSLSGGNFSSDSIFFSLVSGLYNLDIRCFGCEITDSVEIIDLQSEPFSIIPTPLSQEVDLGNPVSIHLNFNVPPSEIQWVYKDSFIGISSDNWQFQGIPGNSDTMSIIGKDGFGCADTVESEYIVNKNYKVYLPNVFSPGSTMEANKRIKPFFDQAQVEEVEIFQVFDRYGSLLHEEKNKVELSGWDGSFRGNDLPPAVFVYFVQVRFIDGIVKVFKGDVMLYR